MSAKETGDWLTAVRMARLPIVLRTVRAYPPPGVPAAVAPRLIWKACGGPLDEVARLVDVLAGASLITFRESYIRLTRVGRTIATQDRQHGGTMLARALINSGYFIDQARRLSEYGDLDEVSGDIHCRRSAAVGAAPQLVGIIRAFPGVRWADRLVIPAGLAAELSDVWVLPARDAQADSRKAIGDRGEFYSYKYEQMQAADPAKIRWVARDDEGLGYDIEDVGCNPCRRIEAKASGGLEPRFMLSTNEWDVAHREGAAYEVHFWGGVNLSASVREEFVRLRKRNFPLIYRDLPKLFADGVLSASPWQYLVTRGNDDSNA